MTIRATVLATITDVAVRQGKSLASLDDDLTLNDSGLDSLCIAIIVARLDDQLGLDPFSRAGDGELPVTIGDFVRFYEHAAE